MEKHTAERNEKVKLKTEAIAHKQMLERNSLKQRMEAEYNLIKNRKDDEEKKLILQYKNRKLDLEMQQKIEQNLSKNENLMKASNLCYLIKKIQRPR